MQEDMERSWDSVCGDCIHFRQDGCGLGQRTVSPNDSIAAVCGGYKGCEKQNYISDHVEWNHQRKANGKEVRI